MLDVLIPCWFCLVHKFGIVIVPGLTKSSEVKVTPEGTPIVMAS